MPETPAIRNVVIGTAGHIDHGKSSLVKALTGTDPDRLQEEKDKGITIDLGFANFLYQERFRVGMIDVPGHEKFVKNMVAGATGIDIVLLVVAADDGVMPQTREHIEILTLLGIRRGVIALNKVDKVDADTVELARSDVQDAVRGTFLEHAPIVPCSAHTRAGLDDLWRALGEAIETSEPRDTQGVFRMPIQRVFSARGQGAVLTGIPVSGTISLGDAVVVLPGEHRGKVRGIQAYHQSLEQARAGHSSALNIAGVDHTLVHRGHSVCEPGVFRPGSIFSLRLTLLEKAERAIKHRAEVKFHVGTSEIMAQLFLLDRALIEPGQRADCLVLLDEPVVAGIGDPFILRLPSPAITLGGGRVIRFENARLARHDDSVMRTLDAWALAAGDARRRVELAILDAGPAGADRASIMQRSELALRALEPHCAALLASGLVAELGPGRALVHREASEAARARLVAALSEFHERQPAAVGLKASVLQQQLGMEARVFQAVAEGAVRAGEVEARADLYALTGQGGKLSEQERQIVERIGRQLEDFALNPPTLKELAQAAGQSENATQTAIDYLVGMGRARVLHEGVLFGTEALENAKRLVIDFLKQKGEAAAKDFKEVLPTSRKYLIPLLEWMDAQGVTRFVGGQRTLKT
jgi:selenocysteine-specific elongation factor